MRLIDGDKLMMWLADWWYSSFGQEETEEAKAIRTVINKVEESLEEFEIHTQEKLEQDRWHSIAKEGKPKESGTYIWTCDDGTHRKLVTVAKYFKRTGECILTGARSYWKAKAWKPLPEAYEEEKNNDDVD